MVWVFFIWGCLAVAWFGVVLFLGAFGGFQSGCPFGGRWSFCGLGDFTHRL